MTEGMAAAWPRRKRPHVRFSAAAGRAICRRVASGESLVSICKTPGMPTHGTVARWAGELPKFGRALARARSAAGWVSPTSAGPAYDEAQAVEIYARLCDGESMKSICADPRMPGHSTVYRWRERFPEFAASIRAAREVQAERFCDLGWEIASAVTPETAYAAHVTLAQLRWTAAALGPKRFGRLKPMAAEAMADEDEGGGLTVYVQRFTDAPDPHLDGAVLAPGEARRLR